ncbi:MAG: hypothetical protein RIQ62_506 [Bacteroidota bacterium]|jgi:hypothetical protein
MNLHIFNDEYGLFPNLAEETINKLAPKKNLLLNITRFQKLSNPRIQLLAPEVKAMRQFVDQLQQVDKIVLHPLSVQTGYLLLLLKKRFPKVPVYWVCWSYDVYNYYYKPEQMYLPFSLSMWKRLAQGQWKLWLQKGLPGYFLSWIFPLKSYHHLAKSTQMVDYFCSLLEEDYQVALQVTPNQRMQYLPFAYLSLEQILDSTLRISNTANTIMLGHAASYESNHVEMIDDLKALHLPNKVLIPLAYGNPVYKAVVIQKAQQAGFAELEIQEEKLSSVAYYTKLSEVAHAVFNVRVQQALGNLLGLIYMGAKVYLREETSTYKQFVRWGLQVYPYSALSTEIQIPMSLDDQNKNREIMRQRFQRTSVDALWEALVQ